MEAYLGTIQLFGLGFAPKGWLACDGSHLALMQYQAVFSLLGTTFGGNGTSDFALPDLRGKEPLAGTHYAICVEGIYPQRP